jgi:hypothetical protein
MDAIRHVFCLQVSRQSASDHSLVNIGGWRPWFTWLEAHPMRATNTAAAIIAASLIASGQSSRRPNFDRFEVATIKPTGTQPGGRWIRMQSMDRFEHAITLSER